jgi:hypothetical protein
MFSLEMKKPSIEKILKELQLGKAVGPDDLPNELLKYGGDIMMSSLADLFIAVTDLETIPFSTNLRKLCRCLIYMIYVKYKYR